MADSKKYDSGGAPGINNGGSGLSQLLTSTASGGGGSPHDSPRTPVKGNAPFGGGPKFDSNPGSGAGEKEDDGNDEIVFGVDLPFTCKVYFPLYKPPPQPAAVSDAQAAAAAVAAVASPAKPATGNTASSSGADVKSPEKPASASAAAAAAAGKARDRLAVEPGMIVVHVTADATTHALITLAVQSCYKAAAAAPSPTANSTPNVGAPQPAAEVVLTKEMKALIANSVLCACDERGVRDDECPALDGGRFIHQFGVRHFALVPLRSAPAATAQQIARLTPVAPATSEPVWCGPKPKKSRLTAVADPNARLFVAAETGRLGTVRRLIEHAFADPNATGIDNWTALHFAARAGHLSVVNYLLKQNVAIDCVTKNKWTALHLSCDKGKYDVTEVLLTVGAEPNSRDAAGHTPAFYAKQNKYTEIVDLMNEFQAEIV